MPARSKSSLAALDRQIWILAFGRSLSALGTGFTLFYTPIFFVNQVGLSATAVGIGLGSASLSGVIGRILGGIFADSGFGRRRTLLLATAISAIASLVLALAGDLIGFVIANLIMGLGVGLYWPANEAVVADLSASQQRQEAYALTRLADNLGLGLGVVLGGGLIAMSGAYRALFVIDALSFALFFGVVFQAIRETAPSQQQRLSVHQGWRQAMGDRRLQVYIPVNILITAYLSQVQTALPLYFTNFVHSNLVQTGNLLTGIVSVSAPTPTGGFNSLTLSGLYTWHLVLIILLQLPLVRWLNRYRRPQVLMISLGCWSLGFLLVWVTGQVSISALLWAGFSLAVLAIATVTYTPTASALVADLAPEALRGTYLSINSLCWAAGYFIGPPLGGLALDQSQPLADDYWLGLALSVVVALPILHYLDQLLRRSTSSPFRS